MTYPTPPNPDTTRDGAPPSWAWHMTGDHFRDALWYIENAPLDVNSKARAQQEFAAAVAKAEALVNNELARNADRWSESAERAESGASELQTRTRDFVTRVERRDFESPTEAFRAVQEARKEIARLKALRDSLAAQRETHEAIVADKLGHYSKRLMKFPALQRPAFSFLPFKSL